ncbi:DUF4019 domain-containing protein [Thalassotalea euphylliae]|nr:DUF4019 domain-containing protein [Thalassotalea euphylliae]
MMKVLLILLISWMLVPVTFANDAQMLDDNAGMNWLQMIDDGEYSKSWQEADSLFKSQLTSSKWQKALRNVRKPLGKVVMRKKHSAQTHTSLPGIPDGHYLVLTFKTQFEQKTKAIETLTLSKQSGEWRAIGYFIK